MVKPRKPHKPANKRTAARRSAPSGNGASTEGVQLPRVAKGKRPQYFSDPTIDKLLWITLTLCEELSVTRDRLDTVERLLDKRRVVRRADIERFVPDAVAEQERGARRAAYIERVMRAVQAELDEITSKGGSAVDEAQAAVAS